MGVKLVSASGGSVEINPPATASNFVATMPAGTGNVVVNGVNGALVAATAQASTSGTSIDFTGIPSWVKRITVMFQGVSTNGTSLVVLRVGTSGGVEATGYSGQTAYVSNAAATGSAALSTGFALSSANAASTVYDGSAILSYLGSNIWVVQSVTGAANLQLSFCGGSKTLSGTLDRVRITTVNGTDAFDAGSINIMYE